MTAPARSPRYDCGCAGREPERGEDDQEVADHVADMRPGPRASTRTLQISVSPPTRIPKVIPAACAKPVSTEITTAPRAAPRARRSRTSDSRSDGLLASAKSASNASSRSDATSAKPSPAQKPSAAQASKEHAPQKITYWLNATTHGARVYCCAAAASVTVVWCRSPVGSIHTSVTAAPRGRPGAGAPSDACEVTALPPSSVITSPAVSPACGSGAPADHSRGGPAARRPRERRPARCRPAGIPRGTRRSAVPPDAPGAGGRS